MMVIIRQCAQHWIITLNPLNILQFCPLDLNKEEGGRPANTYMAPAVCWALFYALGSHQCTGCPHSCFDRQVLLLFPLHTGARRALAPLPWSPGDKLGIWTQAGSGSPCHPVMRGYVHTGLLTCRLPRLLAPTDPSQPLLATSHFSRMKRPPLTFLESLRCFVFMLPGTSALQAGPPLQPALTPELERTGAVCPGNDFTSFKLPFSTPVLENEEIATQIPKGAVHLTGRKRRDSAGLEKTPVTTH